NPSHSAELRGAVPHSPGMPAKHSPPPLTLPGLGQGRGQWQANAPRALRWNSTDAERLLWRSLRRRKTQGVHFRRQAPSLGTPSRIACHRAKVIIELDGSQHGGDVQMQYDGERTGFLESRGYRVLRFWNAT